MADIAFGWSASERLGILALGAWMSAVLILVICLGAELLTTEGRGRGVSTASLAVSVFANMAFGWLFIQEAGLGIV